MFIEAWLACRISSNSTEIATHKKLTHFIFSNKLFFLISLFFWKFVFFKNRKHQMIFTGILYIEYLFQKTLPRALEIFFSNIFRFFSTKRFRCSQQTKIFNATFFRNWHLVLPSLCDTRSHCGLLWPHTICVSETVGAKRADTGKLTNWVNLRKLSVCVGEN